MDINDGAGCFTDTMENLVGTLCADGGSFKDSKDTVEMAFF